MADNVAITAGTGTSVATDDIGGNHYQRIKVTWGADGTANDASATNPLPVASVSGITGIGDDRKVVTTAGTRVALASSTACKQVVITAETDNTGIIVVGGSTVVASLATRRGIPLYPGDTISLEIDNLADVNLDSTVNGDGVTFAYFT
jgi:hypothetical protein